MIKSKKGNVVLVTVGVLGALIVTLGFLVKTTTSRMNTTKRVSDSLYVQDIANSLAILSINYLKENPGDLIDYLSKPLDELVDSGKKEDLKDRLNSDVKNLNTGKSILDTVKDKSSVKKLEIEKLFWEIKKDEFSGIPVGETENKPYTREKTGVIHIRMEISYLPPGLPEKDAKGNKNIKTEIYDYVSEVKVVANILPVLSKFNLYIDDTLDMGDDFEKFNVVKTKDDGNLNSFDYKPWVLKNHSDKFLDFEKFATYNSLITSDRGLVFLGNSKKKPIKLRIAYGNFGAEETEENDDNSKATPEDKGLFGEGFRSFWEEDDDGSPVYHRTLSWLGNSSNPQIGAILEGTIGFCTDTTDYSTYGENDFRFYPSVWEKTDADEYGDIASNSSIFRLYGTDGYGKSPTLVLGFVDEKYISERIFKIPEDDTDPQELNYYPDSSTYKEKSLYEYNHSTDEAPDDITEGEDYDDDLVEFTDKYKEIKGSKLEYDEYLTKFSSMVRSQNYNNSFYFCINHEEDDPYNKYVIDNGGNEEKLYKLTQGTDENLYTKIPKLDNKEDGDYSSIYPGANLGELDKLLDENKLGIGKDGSRIAYTLTLKRASSSGDSGIEIDSDILITDELNFENDFIRYLKGKGFLNEREKDGGEKELVLNLNGWLYIDSSNFEGATLPFNFPANMLVSTDY